MPCLRSIDEVRLISSLKEILPEGSALRFDHTSDSLIICLRGLAAADSAAEPNPPPARSPAGTVPPAYLRLPRSGERCPYTGLTRSMMDSLVRPCAANRFRPPVRSSKIKTAGMKGRRGAVHVDSASLLAYLAGQSREPGFGGAFDVPSGSKEVVHV